MYNILQQIYNFTLYIDINYKPLCSQCLCGKKSVKFPNRAWPTLKILTGSLIQSRKYLPFPIYRK